MTGIPFLQVAVVAEGCAATPGGAAAGEGEEDLGGGHGPRCPPLKSWMLSLTPMSTRSTSEVIGGRHWRPSSSSSSGECQRLPPVGCCAVGAAGVCGGPQSGRRSWVGFFLVQCYVKRKCSSGWSVSW